MKKNSTASVNCLLSCHWYNFLDFLVTDYIVLPTQDVFFSLGTLFQHILMNTVGGHAEVSFYSENTLSYGICVRAALFSQYIAYKESKDSVGFHSLSAVQRAHCWANPGIDGWMDR